MARLLRPAFQLLPGMMLRKAPPLLLFSSFYLILLSLLSISNTSQATPVRERPDRPSDGIPLRSITLVVDTLLESPLGGPSNEVVWPSHTYLIFSSTTRDPALRIELAALVNPTDPQNSDNATPLDPIVHVATLSAAEEALFTLPNAPESAGLTIRYACRLRPFTTYTNEDFFDPRHYTTASGAFPPYTTPNSFSTTPSNSTPGPSQGHSRASPSDARPNARPNARGGASRPRLPLIEQLMLENAKIHDGFVDVHPSMLSIRHLLFGGSSFVRLVLHALRLNGPWFIVNDVQATAAFSALERGNVWENARHDQLMRTQMDEVISRPIVWLIYEDAAPPGRRGYWAASKVIRGASVSDYSLRTMRELSPATLFALVTSNQIGDMQVSQSAWRTWQGSRAGNARALELGFGVEISFSPLLTPDAKPYEAWIGIEPWKF